MLNHSMAPAMWLAVFLATGMCHGSGAEVNLLSGHVPAGVKHLQPKGSLPVTNELRLAIGVPLRDPAGLRQFLKELYQPGSPNYRHYLAPAEFAARFAATESDYAVVRQFAIASGFIITAEHGNRLLLDVTGRVADVERAFHIRLLKYQHPTEAREFFAPDREPSVDEGLPVADIQGLDDYVLPLPKFVKPAAAHPVPQGGTSPNGGGEYFGDDFRAAYVPGTSLTGAGQSVGVLEFLTSYFTNDISAYAVAAGGGRTNIVVQAVLLDSFGGTPTAGSANLECSLDIEMAMAMAPGLSSILVFEGSAWNDILSAMAASNTVKNLSCSWGFGSGPSTTTDAIFQQMSAQGQSFFNATGDTDALLSGSDTNNEYPATSPYIMQAGGTTLTTGTNGAYVSETVWNSGGGVGSSGGYSAYYTIPFWQTNLSMTSNQGSPTMRNVPDVALTADNVYVIYDGAGSATGGGDIHGTSCAAPLWAGFMALVNEQAALVGNAPAGFINPTIYSLGQGAGYTNCFHDINSGNNYWSSSPASFSAVAGYDLCTGWGTPNGVNLLNALAIPDPLIILPASGFLACGAVGGLFTNWAQTFTLTNYNASPLNWSLVNTSAWLTVSTASGVLAVGAPATVTVSLVAGVGTNLAPGSYSATVLFTDQTSLISQPRQFNLQILPAGGFQYFSDVGGPLAWNTSATNWGSASGGAYSGRWVAGDNAVFEGVGGQVNVSTVTAQSLAFGVSGYTLTGGTVTLSGTPMIAFACNTTIASVLADSGAGFTSSGSGTLTLSGTNTYSGHTTISAGTLAIGGAGRLGAGTYAGAITNNGSFLYSSTAAQTLSGNISGSGSLTQQGGGMLTLSGASTYAGGTALDAGTLSGSAGAFGFGVISLNASSTTLAITGGTATNTVNAAAGIYGTLNLTSGLTFGGVFSGSGVLTLAGASPTQSRTFTASGSGGFTGALVAQRGTNNFSGANADFSGTDFQIVPSVLTDTSTYLEFTGAGTTVIKSVSAASGGQFEIGPSTIVNLSSGIFSRGTTSSKNVIIMPTGGGTSQLTSSGGTITFGGASGTNQINAGVALADYGSGTNPLLSVVKTGLHTLTVASTNTYSGATTISSGTMIIQGAGELGGGNYAGNVTNNGVLLYRSTAAQTLSGVISGTGTLMQQGAGTLTLSGTDTYSGSTTISGGTLVLGGAGSLGGGTYAANITNNGSLLFNSTAAQTLSGVVSGSGSLTQQGGGTLTLSGVNTFSGATIISGGALRLTGVLTTVATNTVTVTNAILSGNGIINGPTTIRYSGTLLPGLGGGSTSSLTNKSSLALAGNAWFVLNRTNVQNSSGVAGISTVTYGGTLTVTNDGPALVAGDTFTLFKAASYTGGFTNTVVPALAPGLIWKTNNLAINGSIAVAWSTFTLNYAAGANGTLSGTTTQTVTYGSGGTAVTSLPNTGYHFVCWSDGSTANPRTDTAVTNNLSVTASFGTNHVPLITGTAMSAGGGFTLAGSSGAGQTTILLTVSNLPSSAWTPLATNLADTNGAFLFSDAQATNYSQRFYRLSTP